MEEKRDLLHRLVDPSGKIVILNWSYYKKVGVFSFHFFKKIIFCFSIMYSGAFSVGRILVGHSL